MCVTLFSVCCVEVSHAINTCPKCSMRQVHAASGGPATACAIWQCPHGLGFSSAPTILNLATLEVNSGAPCSACACVRMDLKTLTLRGRDDTAVSPGPSSAALALPVSLWDEYLKGHWGQSHAVRSLLGSWDWEKVRVCWAGRGTGGACFGFGDSNLQSSPEHRQRGSASQACLSSL